MKKEEEILNKIKSYFNKPEFLEDEIYYLYFLSLIDAFLDEIYKDLKDEKIDKILDLNNFKNLDDIKEIKFYKQKLIKLSFKQRLKIFIKDCGLNEKMRKSIINLISNFRNDLAHGRGLNKDKFNKFKRNLEIFKSILKNRFF